MLRLSTLLFLRRPLARHFSQKLAIDALEPREINNLVRWRCIEDVLPLAATLIEAGRMELAENVMGALENYHSAKWATHQNAGLPNRFLKGYLQRGDLGAARRWKEWLFARKHAQPDALTYSILFGFYLENEKLEECRELVDQMEIDGVTRDQILELEYLTTEQKQTFCNVLNYQPPPPSKEFMKEYLSLDSIVDALERPRAKIPRNIDQFPEVVSIESKNGGISFIKDSLQALREDPNTDLYAVQERLERDCYQASVQHMCAELANYRSATNATTYTPSMKRILAQWQLQLSEHLKGAFEDASNMSEASSGRVTNSSGILYSSLLSILDTDKIALMCIQELTRTSSFDPAAGGLIMARLASAIGSSLQKELFAQQITKRAFLQHTKLNPRTLTKIFQDRAKFSALMRKQYAELERNVDALRDGWIPQWSPKFRVEVGVYVVSLAVDLLKFTHSDGTVRAAFNHRINYSKGKSVGVVDPDPELFKMMNVESATVHVDPWSMPMLVPPKPWLTYRNGGYLLQRTASVRLKDDPLHLALIHAADRQGKLDRILLGLDSLGKTPWLINEKILRVALELWNGGMNVATLEAPRSKQESTQMEFRKRDSFITQEEYVDYVRKAVDRKDAISTAHSTMCDTNYKLEIARQFVGLPFYLPHSVDFRGRAYPIPPHLSHVGSDLSRGLLVFAEGKPLGKRGLRWLKIQLANMAGFDKASLDERVAYAERHLENIFDSANRPIDGQQWWRKADEPWQCLATCIELTAALQSPNHEEFLSHLPCQQDGSCNGLQHYAALGGDIDGARQVNLTPADRPQDVYAAVANLVNDQIEKDSASDPNHIANKLRGKINRKVIKQPVMTNVYGVTMYGARAQIKERLKEFKIVEQVDYGLASRYLAKAVFSSLGTLFDGAQQIQQWLTETAVEVARAVPKEVAAKFGTAVSGKGRNPDGNMGDIDEKESSVMDDPSDRYPQTSIFWTTPLGFPVLQPYVKNKTVVLRTVLQNVSLRLSSKFDPVDVAKQASAFPPNFVHSLDATHMFLTALACSEADITFASVHDCFWTHAASVDQMAVILREQFVALHSQPILEKLREEFVARYRGYVVPKVGKNAVPCGDIRHIKISGWRPINIPPIPPRGKFDIDTVLKSEYFFS
jgi:DNA-directed RNA polymerase